jgi:hypothetical protein
LICLLNAHTLLSVADSVLPWQTVAADSFAGSHCCAGKHGALGGKPAVSSLPKIRRPRDGNASTCRPAPAGCATALRIVFGIDLPSPMIMPPPTAAFRKARIEACERARGRLPGRISISTGPRADVRAGNGHPVASSDRGRPNERRVAHPKKTSHKKDHIPHRSGGRPSQCPGVGQEFSPSVPNLKLASDPLRQQARAGRRTSGYTCAVGLNTAPTASNR